MHERRLLGDPGDQPRTREQHVVEDEGSTHMHVYVCVICWCQRLVKLSSFSQKRTRAVVILSGALGTSA